MEMEFNSRENRRGNQKWKILKSWQQFAHKTRERQTKQTNICQKKKFKSFISNPMIVIKSILLLIR